MCKMQPATTKDDLLVQLSGCDSDDKRGVYSLAQVADLLSIPRRRVRAWWRAGLIEPAIEMRGVPYFDFQRVASARTLCGLADAGISTTRIRNGLERLRAWLADAREPLEQLVMLERNGTLLVRIEAGLVEPSGQIYFDFGGDSSIVPVQPTSAEEWFEKGCDHEEDAELPDAIHAYRQALLIGGADADTCFNLGNVLYGVGQRSAAIERYRVAVELDREHAEAWNNLGVALGETGHIDEAQHALAMAVKCGFADARFNLTRLSLRKRREAD
jgi:tetratricopeptide (TPR) repeat protein